MPRNVTASFRLAAESSFSDEVDLVFLTITHPTLSEPIRLNWDTKDFVYGGATFTGFPFDIELLSDDEGPPTARLQIQNIDPRIGDTIRSLTTPPRLKIELLSSSDFDLTVDPRVEAGSSPFGAEYILMEHFDGADTSTTFTDSGPAAHTLTALGNVQIDTAQSKFGGASCLFDGAGDGLFGNGSSDYSVGTGDFEVDLWMRRVSVGAFAQLFETGSAGSAVWWALFVNTSDKFVMENQAGTQITSTTSTVANTWYHVELARRSGVSRLFINGTQEGVNYADSNNYVVGTNGPFIGYWSGGPGSYMSGWIDELRFRKGSGFGHSANFTPETSPYGTTISPTVIYSADRLFLTNVAVDVISISGQIVGWDYVQRVWPGKRATQSFFPGLFR